ncbi:MAG: hypothetical protein DMF76_01750 [Acidobacteria bacterium]|nr:MAG: hypothetical protein DMF76_01750 [Acidobacteriota bacterium]
MDHIRTQVQRMRDRISPAPQSQAIGKVDRSIGQGLLKDLAGQILLRVGQQSLRIGCTRPHESINVTRGNSPGFF